MLPHELALKRGRSLIRPQTGFIHFCHDGEGENHDTIPLLENAYFALALFKSRLADQVLEGKALLERLLAFGVEGNFPIYLHEFPHIQDTCRALRLAPVFYWILRDFGPVLGHLRPLLEKCLNALVLPEQHPHWAKVRFQALKGEPLTLRQPLSLMEWDEQLISLQIAGEPLLTSYWNSTLNLYTGPSQKRYQEGGEPALSFYDLFMSSWTGHFSSRVLKPHILHLSAALIRPIDEPFTNDNASSSWLHLDPKEEWPLILAWEGKNQLHTFVLAKKNLEFEGFTLHFSEEIPSEEKSEEVAFYLNWHPDHQISVDGVKSTTFLQGNKVEITSAGRRLVLSFRAAEGQFFGHIMRGNRPSQLCNKGENRFTAFDWKIGIRTLSRPARCSLQLELEWDYQPLLPSHASHCQHTESHL